MIDIQTSIPFVTDIDHEILPVVSESFSNSGPLHFELCKGLDFTSKNQLPIVNRADFAIPERMSTYHRIKNVNRKNLSGSCVHFFVDDSHIEPLWKHPRLYAKILLRFDTVLSPDFSVFMNMLRIQKWWNDYRNKFLAAHLQRYGVNIIPAPSWADIEDIERYAEGWPKHSLIAINSTGIGYDKRAIHNWLDGYFAMVDLLKPKHILRYGRVFKEEHKDISSYYFNNNQKGAYYGRKRSVL